MIPDCEACGKPDCYTTRIEAARPKPKGFRAWLRGDHAREQQRIQDAGTLEGLDVLWTILRDPLGGPTKNIIDHAHYNLRKASRERKLRWWDAYMTKRIIDLLGAVTTLQREVKTLRQELETLKNKER